MSEEFKINLLEEMDLLYAKIHRLEDVCEQANIMLNQRDEIEEGLNKRIAKLEAERRWIPVSERLPEATEYVYAVVYDAIDNTSKVSMLKHYGDGNWFSWESERYVVTHWMPLPELPEVQE